MGTSDAGGTVFLLEASPLLLFGDYTEQDCYGACPMSVVLLICNCDNFPFLPRSHATFFV